MDSLSQVLELVEQTARHDLIGEPDQPGDLEPGTDGASELYDLLLSIERISRACSVWKEALSDRLRADVETRGPIRFGQEVLTTKPASYRRILDHEKFLDWLGSLAAVKAAINIPGDAVRIKAIRQMATERGFDPKTVEDTLFHVDYADERKLSRMPVNGSDTPLWAKRLEEGQRRG
jgi:hypothetical protein